MGFGGLRIGDVDVMDGMAMALPSRRSGRGVLGVWSRDWGIALVVDTKSGQVIPSETGYFCALRLGKRDS